MTDDIMTRVREWLASCVRVATENGVPEEADLEAAALAHIDGEASRQAAAVAAAREEQARADMEAVNDALARGESWTPNLTATPLADEIAALRARVAYLEGELHETIGENADLVVRAEKAEAERDALRAQLLSERERLERWLTAPDGKQYERGTVQAVFDECDALRAQNEAARWGLEDLKRYGDEWATAANGILREMDEAKPEVVAERSDLRERVKASKEPVTLARIDYKPDPEAWSAALDATSSGKR
jgi:septal ring factor EnvC (AmiA/AmiB activator)